MTRQGTSMKQVLVVVLAVQDRREERIATVRWACHGGCPRREDRWRRWCYRMSKRSTQCHPHLYSSVSNTGVGKKGLGEW